MIDRALESLKDIPRYTYGEIDLGGLTINYNDPLSLYNEYKDIFINGIYTFNPKRSNPVILDAGGYIGLSAIYLKNKYPDSEITVFEPDPEVFRILRKNIRINELQDVKLINSGLAKENCVAYFYPDGSDGGNMVSRKGDKKIEVKIVRLSSFITKNTDLLKMNIEGMEGEVFREIESKLHMIREIIFEHHSGHTFPQNLGEILSILNRNGFRYLISMFPGSTVKIPFKLKDDYRSFNLVYAKNFKFT